MAIRFTHITLYQVNIHSWDCLFCYRDLYLLAVGLWGYTQIVIFCSYLLSPTAPAPCSRCIGGQVARLARPFESRPVDPVRRELFRRLAAAQSGSSYTSGWVAPSTTLPVSPPPLARGTEEGTSARVPRPKGK